VTSSGINLLLLVARLGRCMCAGTQMIVAFCRVFEDVVAAIFPGVPYQGARDLLNGGGHIPLSRG
jgi:hypothetical protein